MAGQNHDGPQVEAVIRCMAGGVCGQDTPTEPVARLEQEKTAAGQV